MGAYYFYCNLDKLEFISIGLCGGAIKHDGIGRGPTARLLARLLVPASVGRGGPLNWAGARLAVLADDHAGNEHAEHYLEGRGAKLGGQVPR